VVGGSLSTGEADKRDANTGGDNQSNNVKKPSIGDGRPSERA